MTEWGRKEYKKAWPSRRPVWGLGAIFATTVVFAGVLTVQYERSWTASEGLYWKDYLKSGTPGQTSARSVSKYTLLEGVVGSGQKQGQRLLIGGEIEPLPEVDGRPGYRLTEQGAKDGIARLTWVTGTFNDRGLHKVMSAAVYADVEGWEFYRMPVGTALAFFVLMLFVAVPRDRKRRMVWKHGRRLRGPKLVTTAELNEKLGRSKLLKTTLPDGVMFINEEQTWADKLFRKSESRWARIPRDREAMHFLIVGDSGTGKSAAIRQLLSQIWERGEAAIVYDPAMEYPARYYSSNMGRFSSPDPSGLYYANPMDPQSLDLYSYGRNNPLINIDPTGMDCIHTNVDTGKFEGFESGDCDNSTEAKANSGQYVDGTVKTIYTSTGDANGIVSG